MKASEIIGYLRHEALCTRGTMAAQLFTIAADRLEILASFEDAGMEPEQIPMSRNWIPATAPPKVPKEYIVMIKGAAEATTLLFDGSYWFEEDKGGWRTYYAVTHWMPLPKAPKED